MTSALQFQNIRKRFPAAVSSTYLNTASCGLITSDSVRGVSELYQRFSEGGSKVADEWRLERVWEVRDLVAQLINAKPSEIALVPNFSIGINFLLGSLGAPKKVVLLEGDYPSLTQPFEIRGYDRLVVPKHGALGFDLDEIKRLIIEEKPDMVAISHVHWLTGFRSDIHTIGALCREHGVLFIVDATQSLGAIPLDLAELQADVVIASTYKWMNAGHGAAIMYISENRQKEITPLVGGYNSFQLAGGQDGGEWTYQPSMRSYEPGQLAFPSLYMLEQALKLKLETGVDRIFQHNMKLRSELESMFNNQGYETIGSFPANNQSSIFYVRGGEDLYSQLAANDVVCSLRSGMVRFAVHFYNDRTDVDRIVDLLKEV